MAADNARTADDLAGDLDAQFTCAALAIGMAAALLEGEEATAGMVDLMALWPDDVAEVAGVVGYRVAMILAEAPATTPEELGALSAHLLSVDNQQEAGINE